MEHTGHENAPLEGMGGGEGGEGAPMQPSKSLRSTLLESTCGRRTAALKAQRPEFKFGLYH